MAAVELPVVDVATSVPFLENRGCAVLSVPFFETALARTIAYQGYRGYQQYDTPLLLYGTGGFALIGLGGLLEGVLFEVFRVTLFQAGFVAALVAAAGMLSILYALYAPNP